MSSSGLFNSTPKVTSSPGFNEMFVKLIVAVPSAQTVISDSMSINKDKINLFIKIIFII